MQPYNASSPSGTETLTLTPDNPMNTTITSSSGAVLYTSTTESTKSTMFTRVHGASGEVLGSLEWRDVLSDRVILGDAPPVAFNDWIKKSLVPFRDHAAFSDASGREYRWKGTTSDTRSMELYAADDKYKEPIARYHRSRRELAPRPQDPELVKDIYGCPPPTGASETQTYIHTPGMLVLTHRAKEIQDLVVLSMLFIEKQSRERRGGVRDSNTTFGLMVGAAV